MFGDSDLDDDKITRVEEYSKAMPQHLADPYFYMNQVDTMISTDDLEKESDDEIIVKQGSEKESEELSKQRTQKNIEFLEVKYYTSLTLARLKLMRLTIHW